MRFSWILVAVSALVGLFPSTCTASLSTIAAVGSKFFDGDGNQFFIKGVAYQPGTTDPLTDTAQCTLDAALMRQLGANTIRSYHVDSSGDHDGCMAAFADAGIYVIVDLSTSTSAISGASPSWTTAQYNNFTAIMDAFATYDNMLAFVVGNEVIAEPSQSNAAPYVKAAAVDLKSYRNKKGYRQIPVGYTAADIPAIEAAMQNYLACGKNGVDFVGLNSYIWCGDETFASSGYQELYQDTTGYSIPIFFSEDGCNQDPPRTFSDQAAILGPDMDSVFSGAIIYEWVVEKTGYGIVSYGPLGVTTGTPTPVAPDFTNLQSQWATLAPTGTPSSSYNPNITPPTCPASTASGWLVDGEVSLPTLMQAVTAVSTSGSGTATNTGSSTRSSPGSTGTSPSVSSSSSPPPSPGPAGHSSGLSTGAKVGIALGSILAAVLASLIAFFLLRRRRGSKGTGGTVLDPTPDGLEVGSPPPKPELDGTIISKPEELNQKPELESNNNIISVEEMHSDPYYGQPPPTVVPIELSSKAHQTRSDSVLTPSELSTIPPTPELSSVSPSKSFTTTVIPRRPVAPTSSSPSTTWSNAPWQNEGFPIPSPGKGGERAVETSGVLAVSGDEDEEELRRIEDEERRIDAAIAESERLRALKEEKAALQERKKELLAARQGGSS